MSRKSSQDPLQQVRFDVRVTAQATEVMQYQLYRNSGSKPIEAVYTFSVPLHATLLGATLVTEGRELKLEVKAKVRAERDYEEALADGKAAYRIEQSRPGLYTLSAGNLAPGQQAELHLRWALLNRWHDNRLALRLPTTLTERYGNPDAVNISGAAVPRSSIFVERHCDASIHIDGTLGNVSWECASHTLQVFTGSNGLDLQGSDIAMDRDIVLVLRRAFGENHFTTLADDGGWMAIAQLNRAHESALSPRHLILVLDCSGSMMGTSIAQARAGAMALLDWLQPEQQINLICFGSRHKSLFHAPHQADDNTLQKLHQRIIQTDANMGGTELTGALCAALKQAQQCDGDADILLLTDGAIWETEKALARLDGSTRVFTIGVGFAANEEVIDRLAQNGRGHCEVVSPNENVADAVLRQYQRICSGPPLMASAQWPEASEQWPRQTEVYPGDAAFLFASGKGQAPDSLTVLVSGQQGGERISLHGAMNDTLANDTLIRLAAAEKLHQIENEEEQQQFAVRYQLVCDSTNLIVVDEAAQVEGMPEVVAVDHMTVATGLDACLEPISFCLPSFAVRHRRDIEDISKRRLESSCEYFDEHTVTEEHDMSFIENLLHSERSDREPLQNGPDISDFVERCNHIIQSQGVACLDIPLLVGRQFPESLISQLRLLTRDHDEHQVVCALLLALAKHDSSLEVPHPLRTHRLDDALVAAVLRLVREHHAVLFGEHVKG